MKKLKRLHEFHYVVTGKNLAQVMKENKKLGRYIDPLGRLFKGALPF